MSDEAGTTPSALVDALSRISNGDREAFHRLYTQTSAKLFGVCLRILPRQEAEEALQEVYLSVWRRAGTFDASRGSAMTWLITLARNRAVDLLRAARPMRLTPLDDAGPFVDPAPIAAEQMEQHDASLQLTRCLDALDPADAKFIRTAFFKGSTYSELADCAGVPLGTVKSRVRRALLKLRECLK